MDYSNRKFEQKSIYSKEKSETQEKTIKEKYDKAWNIIWKICIIITIFGIFQLSKNIDIFRNKLINQNKNYNFPKYSDLIKCVYFMVLIGFFKYTLEHYFQKISVRIMKEQYRNPKNEKNRKLGIIYKKKLAIHMFKGLCYLILTVSGYLILKDLDFYPKSLLGHGWLPNMFIKKYPNSFYFEKPKYFDTYYFFCFSYFSTDLFWLLFINEKQTDFINMLLHHICTISLISFSYLTNFSNIGSIVLLLHVETDIFVHLTRLLIQTDCPEIFRNISGVTLTINFLYVRLYVFGQCLYTIYYYITWEWDCVVWFCFLFLFFLYLMHVNWALMLLYKAILLPMGTSITDTREYELEDKNQKRNKIKKK
jgi:ceramide synthetase